MSDTIEQIELFAPQGGWQPEETPPLVAEHEPLPLADREHPWLTKEKLFDEIESWDAVRPERKYDGLHLIAQEMESADYVPKNTTEQTIRFDEDEQFVVWEEFCPDWTIPDVMAAHRFAANWMGHHPRDAVIVNEKSRRITWRRSFRTEWVEDGDELDALSQLYLYDAMHVSIECLNAARLALGGF